MLRRTPLFTAVNPAVVSSGLMPDRQLVQTVLWAEASGVRFYDGKVKHKRGNTELVAVGSLPIRGIGQQRLLSGQRAVWIGEGPNIWRMVGSTPANVFTFPAWAEEGGFAAPPTFYDFTMLGDWTFINSGIGAVRWWNGSEIKTISEMPQNILQLEKKYSFLLAFGTGARKTGVAWSDADNVEKWLAAPANTAGELFIDDFDGPMVAVSKLGENSVCYAAEQVALVTFLGEPFYFGQRVVLDGIGAVGKMAVASNGRINVGVGRNGVWLTDGQEARYIDEGMLHDYLQEDVNWNYAEKIVCARNDRTGCFDIYFPMRDSTVINEGWSFDPRFGGWTPILPVQLQSARRVYEQPLISPAPGVISRLEAQDVQPNELKLKTRPLLMQVQGENGLTDVHTDCRVDEIELLFKDAQNIQFRVGVSHDPKAEPDWIAWEPVDPNKQTYLLPYLSSGIYFTLEFRGQSDFVRVIDDDGALVIDDDGAQIIDGSGSRGYRFDLQGFMLFGQVEGTKRGL